ncbi:MAG: Ig-like domain-containing protein [Flavobacterium sp.]|nr:Ig-like domain-containing protein [Flavobacterium sp.]
MKRILQISIVLLLLSFSHHAKAQTLIAGDIVVLGISADTGTIAVPVPEFSWMPLVNLTAGTKIYFTDAGWNTASNEFMATGLLDELCYKYIVPAGGVLAGTVQTVTGAAIPTNYTQVVSSKCGNDNDGLISLPNAGDTIIVFQSNATEDINFPGTNFTAIFGCTTNTTDWASMTTTTAATAAAFKDNYSNLPPGLTNGTSAVAVGNNSGQSDESDNSRYEGTTTSGSRAVILSAICTYANWKRYDVGGTNPDFSSNTANGWTAFGRTSYSITGSDITPPVVQSIALTAAAANAASVTYTITFNESVNNVSADDFQLTVTGTGVTGVIGTPSASSGTSMTVTVSSITGTGTLRLDLKSNTNITDATGNGNNTNGFVSAYNTGGVQNVDLDAPTLTITSSATNPTNLNPIPVTFTFSESVTGFDSSDVVVTGGSIGSVSGSGANYTANITPTADGAITVNVAAAKATDAATNGNTAATQLSRTSDRTSPTIVSMNASVANPTNSNSFTLTITFSESVSNFVVGDLSMSNASLSSFSGGSGSVYTVTVTPTADGTVTANISAGVATDAAGNGNAAATQFSITVDRSQPTVSITSSVGASITNSNPIPVTITFSEAVSNFVQGDISVGNGTISGYTVNSSSIYSFNLIPSGNGTVTVNVAANAANDSAGNGNAAATQFSKTFDSTNPTVSITSVTTSPTNSSSIPITVTFSETVTGFNQSDITPGNGSITNFSGSGANYSFSLTPTSAGAVTASIVGGIATDAAGNGNSAATQFSIIYDNSQPTVNINSATSSPTNSGSIPVTFTFSESVTGFTIGDVSVSNGSLSVFSGSGTTYTATLTPSAAGTVTVNVGANAANDAAGNGNTAATQFSIVYDNSQPTVSITSTSSASTNINPIPVTVTFNESVSNFVSGDITIGNGSISNFSGSGTTYTFSLTPSANGTVTVDIAAGVANDAANNTNTAATQLSRVYDTAGPTLVISSSASNPTNANTIPLTFTFSENVTGFDISDISAFGGSISAFGTTNASVYTATLTPSGDGSITIFVFQGNATDSTGNGNSFASYSNVSDKTKPTITISSGQTSPTSTNPFTVNINFSESVTGFDQSDITTTGAGSLSGFSGSGSSYSVNFSPTTNGNKTFNIAINKAFDAAGNGNNAASQYSIVYIAPCSQTTTYNFGFWSAGDPVATQPAVIAADYQITSDFAACSLIIGNNAHVTVDPGVDVTITGNVTVQTGSSFTFASNANLLQNGTVNNNSGVITYKRDAVMRRLNYVYWSTPVAGQNLKLFSPMTVSPPIGSSRFYNYDETINSFVAIAAPENETMTAPKGYMVRAPNDFPVDLSQQTFNGEFTGVPNNGNYSIPVTFTTAGYNMIGNPYPSPINADLFLATNPGTLYFWTHVEQSAGSAANYATYTTFGTAAGSGGEVPNGTIQAGQGFMLKKAVSGTASFTNAMRVGNNDGQFYKTANNGKSRIWLNLSSGSTFMNQMLVGYAEGATTGVDESIDGRLIDNGSTTLSNLINNETYAIQGRPMPFENTDTVTLNFKAAAAGDYTISIDHVDGLFLEDLPIFIKDNLTGIVHNIKDSTYTFATSEGTFTNRFELIYQNTTLGTGSALITPQQIIIYKQNEILNINTGSANMQSVKVFDMRGRMIYEKDGVSGSVLNIHDLKAAEQVLLVKITFVDGKVITKKVAY